MPPPRIAIATPSVNAWSETFIAAHLKRLQEVVLVLSGGSLPFNADGRPLLSATGLAARLHNLVDLRVRKRPLTEVVQERIRGQLRSKRVEVLLAEYGPTGMALLDCAQAAGVPLVVHFHGYDAHRKDVLAMQGNYQRLFGGAAALVVVSRAMEQQLLALGAPREKVYYIVYGIDTGQFTAGDPAANPPHFLGVGRFTDKKAPLLTVLAFHRLWLQRPEARLTLAGDGALRESVRQLAQVLGMKHAVDLPGVLAPEQIAVRMHGARAFVQHSVTTGDNDMEGTPLAVLEAMACGLPVIATRHAGIPDVVAEGQRGLLCDEYDVETMAKNMLQVADHPGMAGRMGQAGRQYVEQHHRVEESMARLQDVLARAAC